MIAFNTAEGWARDVTEQIAHAVLSKAHSEPRSIGIVAQEFLVRVAWGGMRQRVIEQIRDSALLGTRSQSRRCGLRARLEPPKLSTVNAQRKRSIRPSLEPAVPAITKN